MEIAAIMLLTMIFLHVVADFNLQTGEMKKWKQKLWWDNNYPDELYEDDYKMILAIHSFVWSFVIHIPIMAYILIYDIHLDVFSLLWTILLNVIAHYIIDDMKANQRKISLLMDQALHYTAVTLTWLVYMFWLGIFG